MEFTPARSGADVFAAVPEHAAAAADPGDSAGAEGTHDAGCG